MEINLERIVSDQVNQLGWLRGSPRVFSLAVLMMWFLKWSKSSLWGVKVSSSWLSFWMNSETFSLKVADPEVQRMWLLILLFLGGLCFSFLWEEAVNWEFGFDIEGSVVAGSCIEFLFYVFCA